MKKFTLLLLSVVLVAAACKKDEPNVDTTEQQQLIVGCWLLYQQMNSNGEVVGTVDTSTTKHFEYYSNDGKAYFYQEGLDDKPNLVGNYAIVSNGNNIFMRYYSNTSHFDRQISSISEINLNIEKANYIRANWASNLFVE